MPHLPAGFVGIIAFAPLFVHRSWKHAQVLLISGLLAPGQRTVAILLRSAGLSRERHFVNDHRRLSRAAWCPRTGARILLGLFVTTFVPDGPMVIAIGDTIECRRGRRIKAMGIYRDPVRSSDAHFVKTSGLGWMSLMLLAPIPRARRVWALPVLTALAPSERFCQERGHRHKTLLDWGRQMAHVPGWYGAAECTIEIISATAVWQHGGLLVVPIRWVLIRDPRNRFAPQALLCTDPTRDPAQIVGWFVRRWQVEVTFQEARSHLGIETQRQWSDRAIARTTPCLLALFSIVTLMASRLPARERRQVAQAAWYRKPQPTFSDALAAVRWAIWREQAFVTSRCRSDRTKVRFALPDAWAYALCYAA
jgi:hypothetical protein